MKYRGFDIRTVDAIDLLRYNAATDDNELCHGVYCEVYNVSDDGLTERLDDFTLAEGYEIPDCSAAEIEKAISDYVDEHIIPMEYYRADALADRRNHLIGRLVSWIGEEQQGRELYDTLSAYIGMTDEEICSCGFKSLVPYFDQDEYAQTIADEMIRIGTDNTTDGGWIFLYEYIGEKFGVDLDTNHTLLDKICRELSANEDIVAAVDVHNRGFEITFNADYCPYIRSDDISEDSGQTMQ